MEKHFITFLSPGTFVNEETTKEVYSWDVDEAVKMAATIKERHGVTPFAFYFSTRGRNENELDSKEINRSNRYYLGGKVETIDEVRLRDDPKERILISNMECNGCNKIIVNTNSWRVVQPLGENDKVLEVV